MTFAARLGLAALLLAASAAAAEHKMPGLTFDKPTEHGWDEKVSPGGILLSRIYEIDGRKGAALIAIESKPFAGDFEAAFDTALRGVGNMDADKKPTVLRRGATTSGHAMAWGLLCCRNKDGTPMQVTTVAFHPPDAMITAHLVLINTRDDDMEDAIEAAFEALVAGFDFAGEGVRPPLPPLAAGDEQLEGLYLNVSSGLVLNPLGGMDFEVDMDTLFFDRDGRLADQPPAGSDSLAAFCTANAPACGVYRREGDSIVMRTVGARFGLVSEERATFARDGDALTVGGADYHPVAPVNSLKLDGVWTAFRATTGQIGTTSTSFASARTLALTADGRYRRSGFAAVSSQVETGDTDTSVTGSRETPEETGAYTIDGYTLTLVPEGGAPQVLSIYLPDAGDIDLLVIDGANYLREGRD